MTDRVVFTNPAFLASLRKTMEQQYPKLTQAQQKVSKITRLYDAMQREIAK